MNLVKSQDTKSIHRNNLHSYTLTMKNQKVKLRNQSHLPLQPRRIKYLRINLPKETNGEGNGNPLQYSCLENTLDRGAWWAAVHGVTQSRPWLKRLGMHACIGEGHGNPLQYSCLENPRDGGVWWAAVYGVAQSQTRLKRLSSSSNITECYGIQ